MYVVSPIDGSKLGTPTPLTSQPPLESQVTALQAGIARHVSLAPVRSFGPRAMIVTPLVFGWVAQVHGCTVGVGGLGDGDGRGRGGGRGGGGGDGGGDGGDGGGIGGEGGGAGALPGGNGGGGQGGQ